MRERSYARSTRIADLIKEEVATIFLNEVSDPRVKHITITDVRLGDDLKLAKIYYVSSEKHEDKTTVEGLSKAKGFIRREIAKRVKMRRVPDIEFHYDDVFEQGLKMENILRDIKHEN
ncbi:MAG: 30S ribosome-binding factor RbfA [Proteobacteria bacterium]|nr:30S ribosome-binding factor RbfA [Pseudomonadota bacterium]